MKRPPVQFIAAAIVLCLHHSAIAVDDATRTAAYQSSVSQDQLRLSSQRLKQEMTALVDEYSSFGAATKEVAKLKAVVQSLNQVSEQDMAAVAQALAAASRNETTTELRSEIVKATTSQKQIQSTLLGLADKLTQYADESALQKRIEDLALRQSTNLHATRQLVTLTTATEKPSERAQRKAIEDHSLRKAEQASLQKEIGLAFETLQRLTKSADADTADHLAKALAAAETGKLIRHTAAATTTLKSALPKSVTHQGFILHTLKSMADSLAASRTPEEQIRELAAKIEQLSQEEQNLSEKASRLNDRNNDQIGDAQQDIANRLDLIKERIEELSDQATQKTEEATDRAEKIAQKIAEDDFVKDSKNRDITKKAQQDLAEKLSEISETLQQQADQLAEQSDPTDSATAMSDEEQAIQDAMENLLQAKANNKAASKQNDKKQDYSENLEKAREQLANAEQNASKAGQQASDATQDAQDALNNAEKHAALAAEKKQTGHNLHGVNVNIDKALASLQQAANQLASAEKSQVSQNPESSDQNSGQMMEGEGTGGIGEAKGPPVTKRYTAGSASGDAQRDALNLLKQEKAAPDYGPMVNQYIKNLANE